MSTRPRHKAPAEAGSAPSTPNRTRTDLTKLDLPLRQEALEEASCAARSRCALCTLDVGSRTLRGSTGLAGGRPLETDDHLEGVESNTIWPGRRLRQQQTTAAAPRAARVLSVKLNGSYEWHGRDAELQTLLTQAPAPTELGLNLPASATCIPRLLLRRDMTRRWQLHASMSSFQLGDRLR